MNTNQSLWEQFLQLFGKVGLYVAVWVTSVGGLIGLEYMNKKKITAYFMLGASLVSLCVGVLVCMLCFKMKYDQYTTAIAIGVSVLVSRDLLTALKAKGARRIIISIAAKDWQKIFSILKENDKKEKK